MALKTASSPIAAEPTVPTETFLDRLDQAHQDANDTKPVSRAHLPGPNAQKGWDEIAKTYGKENVRAEKFAFGKTEFIAVIGANEDEDVTKTKFYSLNDKYVGDMEE